MWKPASTTPTTNPNQKPAAEPEKPVMSTTPTLPSEPTPVAAPRNAVLNNTEQATIGKSLVIKGDGTLVTKLQMLPSESTTAGLALPYAVTRPGLASLHCMTNVIIPL